MIKEAQEKLTKDSSEVLKFLTKLGFSDDEITREVANVINKYENAYGEVKSEEKRFKITQPIIVNTKKFDLLKQAKIKLSELIEKDICVSSKTNYYYKDLGSLRIEMIKEAAKDSQNRAIQIASSIGAKIKSIRNIATGSFSIFSDDSSATSDRDWDEGRHSIKKRIRLVIHGTYNLR